VIAALLLAFREGLESALILGVVVGVLGRIGRSDQVRIAWFGTGLAVVVSLAIGISLTLLGFAFEGRVEAIFEGPAMLLAAGVLTWMIFWMASQGRGVQARLEQDVRHAALGGGQWALFILAFVAVLREGIELALFLTAAAFASTAGATILGAGIGLVAAALAGWLLFFTTARLNVRTFFRVTSVLLVIFAAGLVAHGIHELNEAGLVPAIVEHVWDLNPVLDEESGLGQILKALVGYNGNPSLAEVVAYAGYWLTISAALWCRRARTEQVPALSGGE